MNPADNQCVRSTINNGWSRVSAGASNMANRNIVVVGGSAGGIDAARHLVPSLKPDLPAAVFIVLHAAHEWASYAPVILGHKTGLPVQVAVDGESIQSGRIYLPSPDRHLVIRNGAIRVTYGAREN